MKLWIIGSIFIILAATLGCAVFSLFSSGNAVWLAIGAGLFWALLLSLGKNGFWITIKGVVALPAILTSALCLAFRRRGISATITLIGVIFGAKYVQYWLFVWLGDVSPSGLMLQHIFFTVGTIVFWLWIVRKLGPANWGIGWTICRWIVITVIVAISILIRIVFHPYYVESHDRWYGVHEHRAFLAAGNSISGKADSLERQLKIYQRKPLPQVSQLLYGEAKVIYDACRRQPGQLMTDSATLHAYKRVVETLEVLGAGSAPSLETFKEIRDFASYCQAHPQMSLVEVEQTLGNLPSSWPFFPQRWELARMNVKPP